MTLKSFLPGQTARLLIAFLPAFSVFFPQSWAEGSAFHCAGSPNRYYAKDWAGIPSLSSQSKVSVLLIFAKFKGEAPEDTLAPAYARDILNPNRPGSLSHFYSSMSRGALTITGTALEKMYSSNSGPSHYTEPDPETGLGRFGEFNWEVLEKVDVEVDFGEYDNDGPDGIPNSGDDDGYVDFIFINLRSAPEGFFIGTATGFASLGFEEDFITNDPAKPSGLIKIPGIWTAKGGTVQMVSGFSHAVGSMAHEFGHVLGLPDLYDTSFLNNPEQDLKDDSAGIGNWGLMGRGTLGWNGNDGPNSFCAWSREQLGWIEVVEVDSDLSDVAISDVETGGAVYKLSVSDEEYFLVANRQPSEGYYDRNIPKGGLLIWHIDERASNDEERHKMVDLECADGLFTDGRSDPIRGEDDLDRWSRDEDYARHHRGNLGDQTDVFDGERFTSFSYDTNPNSNSYSGLRQGTTTGVAIRNIRRDGENMIADFSIEKDRSGHISRDVTWSGEVEITGDVVVDLGATLTIAGGTEVEFSTTDEREGGVDPSRCELIVYGDLRLEGTASEPVVFSSAARDPQTGDWYGIRVIGGERDIDFSGTVVEHSEYGIVRTHLPGDFTWSGQILISEDTIIPRGATLTLSPGTTVRFAEKDQGGRGVDPLRCELVVEGGLVAHGTSASPITFTSTGQPSDTLEVWYGIRAMPGAKIDLNFCILMLSAFGLVGKLEGPDSEINVDNSLIRQNAGGGVNLSLSGGRLRISNSTIELNSAEGISVSGTGSVLLQDCTIQNNLKEGLSIANCDLEARGSIFSNNGAVEDFEQRSGIRATAGASGALVLSDCTVENNGEHGLNLRGWRGEVEIRGGAIRDNTARGVYAIGAHNIVLEGPKVERNGSDGVYYEDSNLDCRGAVFSGNGGSGLVAASGTSGIVEECSFLDRFGIRLSNSLPISIRRNSFEKAQVALLSLSSSPEVNGNLFKDNSTAIRCTGSAVPSSIKSNSFIGNTISIQNLTALSITAEHNWWGTDDPEMITAQIQGPVDWQPFLTQELADSDEAEPPKILALGRNHPNPFNWTTTIEFQIPHLGDTEARRVLLEIFDVLGHRVKVLLDEKRKSGYHSLIWDGTDESGNLVSSGVYFYRMTSGAFVRVRKLSLMR